MSTLTPLEALRIAHQTLTFEGLEEDDPEYLDAEQIEARAAFITLSYALMPALLDAADTCGAYFQVLDRELKEGMHLPKHTEKLAAIAALKRLKGE